MFKYFLEALSMDPIMINEEIFIALLGEYVIFEGLRSCLRSQDNLQNQDDKYKLNHL